MNKGIGFLKIAAIAASASFSMAFGAVSNECKSEIADLPNKKKNFNAGDFAKDLAASAATVKALCKVKFTCPADSKMTDAGLTTGCVKQLPMDPKEILSLLKDVGITMGANAAANKLGTSELDAKENKASGGQGYASAGIEGTSGLDAKENKVSSRQKNASAGVGGASCSDKQYNLATEFCHNGTVYSRCEGRAYNPSVAGCCSNALYALSNKTEACIDNILQTICGMVYYNPAKESCSGNKIYPKCGNEMYDPSTHYCHTDNKAYSCGNKPYNPATQYCSGSAILAYSCGNKPYNPETQFCSRENVVYAKCGGREYDPLTHYCNIRNSAIFAKCDNKSYNQATHFCDMRDNKRYGFVNIGGQVWMKENLNHSATGSKCYDGESENCAKYGRLYNWETTEKICPAGWRLPSDEELQTLVDFAGGNDNAGKKLKAKSWNSTDDHGFSALPGGYGKRDGSFSGVGNVGYWWSDTEDDAVNAYSLYMSYNSESARVSKIGKAYFLSVRCVKD